MPGPPRRSAASLFAERPPLGWVAARGDYRWLVVGTVCVGAFLGQLDASIAGLVLPTLETVFQAPVAAVEWVAISYLLTLAALVVPFGRLADLMGRKLLYTAGFLVFVGGSALCGLAPSLGWLIAFRVVQAVGAALLQANSVAIIAAAAGPRELGRAIGVQGAAQAVGLSLGPSVGGLIIAFAGWRWVFLLAVPFGLVGALLGWFVLPQTPPLPARPGVPGAQRSRAGKERFDWAGAALFGPAVAAGMLALSFAQSWGWMSPRFLACVGASLALLVAFALVERRAAYPLVDFALFRQRPFSAGILAGLLSYSVLFGSLFLVPFFLERMLGRAPAEAGLLLSPLPLALGVLAPLAGLLTDQAGPRLPTVAGMACAALALLLLAAFPLAPLPGLLAVLALLGAGLGLFTPPNNSAIMASAPPHRLGVASGVLNMTRSLGTSLGIAATGTVLSLRLEAYAGHPVAGTTGLPPSALLPAFRETLLFLAALAVLAAAVSLTRGLRPRPARAPSRGLSAAAPARGCTAETAERAAPGTAAPQAAPDARSSGGRRRPSGAWPEGGGRPTPGCG